MTRKESREVMMQILYELEAAKEMNLDFAISKVDDRIKGKEHDRALPIISQIVSNIQEIDNAINKHSKAWKTARMPKVDLAILRLAIGEAKYSDDVSEAVVISEAINIAKKFSTEQSASFIHGVFGAVLKDEN